MTFPQTERHASSRHAQPSLRLRSGPSDFPGLRQIVREVEAAWALRETQSVVSAINARMPSLIERYGPQLSHWMVDTDARTYRRIELHHCPLLGFQILAMVWAPGQGTAVHDHREQWGIESVWQGELEVLDFAATASAGELLRLEPASVSRIPAGESLGFTPEHGLHLCRNPSRRETTVSLHVYARALDHFNEYVDQGDGWYQRRAHTPPVER